MDRETWMTFIAVIAAAFAYVFKTGRRIGRMEGRLDVAEGKADTMWTFQRRRGKVEALNRGVVVQLNDFSRTQNLTPEWRAVLEPLRQDIQDWYRYHGHGLKENDLFRMIEDVFGERLVAEVCIRYDIHNAACLVAAALLCRETQIAVRSSSTSPSQEDSDAGI